MDRCDPVEMRKNLEVVQQFKKAGIDFVPVPVRDESHKKELILLADSVFQEFSDYTPY